MSKLMVGVVEKFDAANGDDLMLRSAVQYVLRGLLVGEDGPRADWTPEEVRDRVLNESCGLVVVILDGEALDQIGPKCYAAIEAAQQSARPLIVLAPAIKAARFRARPYIPLPRVASELLHSGRILPEEIAALGEP